MATGNESRCTSTQIGGFLVFLLFLSASCTKERHPTCLCWGVKVVAGSHPPGKHNDLATYRSRLGQHFFRNSSEAGYYGFFSEIAEGFPECDGPRLFSEKSDIMNPSSDSAPVNVHSFPSLLNVYTLFLSLQSAAAAGEGWFGVGCRP